MVSVVGLLCMSFTIILLLIAMTMIKRLCQRFHGDAPLMVNLGCGNTVLIELCGQETHIFPMSFIQYNTDTYIPAQITY